MSRIRCERGISYDEERKVYYLYTELGRDANGKRLRRYSTHPTISAARKARDAYLLEKEQAKAVPPTKRTLDHWLEEWMKEIIIPNRAETRIIYPQLWETSRCKSSLRKSFSTITPN